MTSRTELDRRTFLRLAGSTVAVGAAAVTAGVGGATASAAAAGGGRRLVPPGKLGIQLYSIRDKVSSVGFRAVFERLSTLGYREVEFAGYTQGSVGPITPAEIRTLLDDNGLVAVGAHRGIRDFARTVGGYLAAAEQFNGFGAAAAARGLKFYQHNHQHEFAFATDDPSVRLYDVFLANTDPGAVFLEMDVFWAFVGRHLYPGFEPVEYVLAHRDRYPLFHLKDGRVNPQSSNGYDIVEFGVGDLDFQEFLGALAGSGRQHGIWEQDNAASVAEPPFGVDSFGNAERSADAILALRARG
ncbi:sugar phosphate isomerase/epimerase [Isoptericola sp. 4D.3]|uniref:Sugar phosphate isomerase/epimerase n=1 Tax=Isoptericola peretonis TaxID=2918523 RepID=A0ABT0J8S3_9MICO|nr:sugar phosphate isomerase/epimerase [Isoptericola sp. 4D.3]